MWFYTLMVQFMAPLEAGKGAERRLKIVKQQLSAKTQFFQGRETRAVCGKCLHVVLLAGEVLT